MAEPISRCILVGIGNPDRGDDAAGRLVVRRLVGALPEEIEIVELDGEATALVARLQHVESAILVDTCVSGASAGTVRQFDVASGPLPESTFGVTTHGFGLAEAVELARALGQLPARCVVYAIEGASFEIGKPLSEPVAIAVEEVAVSLRTELAGLEQSGDISHA